jgi:DASH complex subunit DAD3
MASENQDAQLSASQASGADIDNETLSPLEQEVLDEYARLLGNLNNVRLDAPPVLHSPDSYLLSLWLQPFFTDA